MAQEQLAPYVAPDKKIPEFTLFAAILGCILSIVLGAANAYLGLYAGMTVSASIPAAVISMGIMRGVMRRGNILQNNIVQTIASAGESLAAGIIFTVPALVLVGAWKNFEFWPTTVIALCGGILGVVFMIPLRRALIVEEKELIYPEGTACAEVLIVGEEGGEGLKTIAGGMLLGGLLKFFAIGLGLMKGALEWSTVVGGRVVVIGTEVSAALIGVGYIINIEVAALVFLGGTIAWLITIPLLGIPESLMTHDALETAWTLWSTKVRYMGVGAMLVGGVWSLYSVRRGISKGVSELKKGYGDDGKGVVIRTERDLRFMTMAVIFLLNLVFLMWLYKSLVHTWGLTVLTTVAIVIGAFLFTAVSSYIVGLVGSSNNPVSGMTICALLGTSALMLIFGMHGDSAILATLGVAGVVCCAACIAGDCSQDLKTGYIVGATPRKQQIAEVLGVVVAAFVMAPTLVALHKAYGIGTGLKAPQATLFASITQAIFGGGSLPLEMVYWGMGIGVVLIIVNERLKKSRSRFRTHVMPVAIGIYLPITLSVPIFVGGLARVLVETARARRNLATTSAHDPGVLLSSGLIAGEAIMGILVAILISSGWQKAIQLTSVPDHIMTAIAVGALAAILLSLRKAGLQK
ncbi:MAG: oligopeptide transporter, OPT family [Deltaproteobacteria bacterium]|nr:oligopeptide transporter, OPT family [Deltaproteobacteria bacterium]